MDGQTSKHSHFWFMGLIKPNGVGSFSTYRRSGTTTPPRGATRESMFEYLKANVIDTDPETAGATIMSFDIQPNKL
ncbi:hypothetical protein [Streptomyces chartreusis]|uniref:hypothetical protein n=1 Tax=Streptomyces chartreusis TaxID=1969 RepID=UPI0036251208